MIAAGILGLLLAALSGVAAGAVGLPDRMARSGPGVTLTSGAGDEANVTCGIAPYVAVHQAVSGLTRGRRDRALASAQCNSFDAAGGYGVFLLVEIRRFDTQTAAWEGIASEVCHGETSAGQAVLLCDLEVVYAGGVPSPRRAYFRVLVDGILKQECWAPLASAWEPTTAVCLE